MNFLLPHRSTSLIAVFAALFMLSGNASATLVSQNINIGGFAGGGNLNLIFMGDTGANELLEHPAEVTAFTATYTDFGQTITWDIAAGAALGSLLWDNTTGTLVAVSAMLFPVAIGDPIFDLSLGAAAMNPANYVEINAFGMFGPQSIATSQQFPAAAPAPGTLLLLSLGLMLLGRRRT